MKIFMYFLLATSILFSCAKEDSVDFNTVGISENSQIDSRMRQECIQELAILVSTQVCGCDINLVDPQCGNAKPTEKVNFSVPGVPDGTEITVSGSTDEGCIFSNSGQVLRNMATLCIPMRNLSLIHI